MKKQTTTTPAPPAQANAAPTRQSAVPARNRPDRGDIARVVRAVLKTLIALAAAANLIALFVFHYETPAFLRRTDAAAAPAAAADIPAGTPTPTPAQAYLSVPVTALSYSGEEDLDAFVLQGVYLIGTDGQPVSGAAITYALTDGDGRLRKTVTYSVTTDDGVTLTADRPMTIADRYTGPTITLLGDLPGVEPENAAEYAAILTADGVVRADDGFGGDASDRLQSSVDDLDGASGTVHLTLTLENVLHDSAVLELEADVLDYSGVVVALTDYAVTIPRDSDFDPLDYVAYAHDRDGDDVSWYLHTEGSVDTSEPGDYTVRIWATDAFDTRSPVRTLRVTVAADGAAVETDEPADETESEPESEPADETESEPADEADGAESEPATDAESEPASAAGNTPAETAGGGFFRGTAVAAPVTDIIILNGVTAFDSATDADGGDD